MRFADILMAAASRGGGVDPDLAAWVSAVVTNGGTVSAARAAIVGQFIAAEKAAGTWALTDDYLAFWAESATQALTSLKQRRLATVTSAPTFTQNRDYTFDGATNYIDTGFIAGTHGINYTASNQRIGVYERTNLSSTGYAAGVSDGNAAAAKITFRPRASGNMHAGVNTDNSTPATFAISPADSRGLKTASRAGGTTALGYDRGVRLTDATGLTVASGAPTRPLYIGAINNIGTAASFRAASVGFVVIGGPLSDAQELAQYNNVQAFAVAVGANV